MTVLAELARLYERLRREGKVPLPGYSTEKISGEVVLDAEGNVLAINDLRVPDDKGRLQPRLVPVPAAFKRTSGIKANRLWDKTSYSLGVTRGKDSDGNSVPEPEVTEKSRKEHEDFIESHEALLDGRDDPGLRALLGFLRSWRPEMFAELGSDRELLDLNLVFRIEGDEVDGQRRFLHCRPAAEWIVQQAAATPEALCLVSGEQGPVARLHPAIKGVACPLKSGPL